MGCYWFIKKAKERYDHKRGKEKANKYYEEAKE